MTEPKRLVHDADGLNTAVWPVVEDRLVTNADEFFTRSHAPVPAIDPAAFRLDVGGLVRQPRAFSLEELMSALPRRELTATIVCAGMRRAEFFSLGPLPGELPWGPEPASTGRWSGVSLGGLLELVGVEPDARYVELEGLDVVEREDARFGFGGSIDLEKALTGAVLLATTLNDAPLPPQHGAPLRAVVPGWIGARSVKWLGRIRVLAEPSPNYFQRKAYRVQRTPTPGDPRDVTLGEPLGAVALNAVIAEPMPGARVTAGVVRVRGWAIGGNCETLERVEVSPNGTDGWAQARLLPGASRWTWSFWEAEVELPPGEHELAVRATDASGGRQPASLADVWNVKGYANNAWHRVRITAE